MAYASFRCLVKAPLTTVWKSLQNKVNIDNQGRTGAIFASSAAEKRLLLNLPQGTRLQEEVMIDSERNEIVVRLKAGQSLEGERRFALRAGAGQSASVLDSVLNWKTSSSELDREIMQAAVEVLVRDFALEIKLEIETEADVA